MLERGHFQELHNLLELLNVDEGKKRRRQNFVFSATLTMVHEPPGRLKSQNKKLRLTPGQKLQNIMTMLGVTNPKVVDVTKESGERIFCYSQMVSVHFVFGLFHVRIYAYMHGA
jgi:ATP-dependent RNA helicase DDX24/MAK5